MSQQPLPPHVRSRVVADFPGEAHLTSSALSGLAEAAGRDGHDVAGVLTNVLDQAQGSLVRLDEALRAAHRRYGC